jgi:hypothetical protein
MARLGTAGVAPDPNNVNTTRALQVSREGKVILAEMDTRSDIYLLEGLRPGPAGWLTAVGERFGR